MPPPHSSTRLGVLRIALFSALLLAAMFGADRAITAGLRRVRTSEFGVTNRAMLGEANAEIVISGSSRALTHYDARIIQQVTGYSTFNIGRNGSQTDMQLAFLRAYLQNNKKPRLIIHNLDLYSFVTSQEIFDPAQYMPYLAIDSIYTGVHRVYPEAWKWKYLPLYRYAVEDMRFTWIQGLLGLVGVQPREDHFQGFMPRHTAWTGDFDSYRRANPHGVEFKVESQGVHDLNAVVELCRQYDVPLMFVYSPEYTEMQAIEKNRAEIFDLFGEICDRNHVPLWDYSGSTICQSQANFYNSQHLNAEGANLFSIDLAHRLAESNLLPDSAAHRR